MRTIRSLILTLAGLTCLAGFPTRSAADDTNAERAAKAAEAAAKAAAEAAKAAAEAAKAAEEAKDAQTKKPVETAAPAKEWTVEPILAVVAGGAFETLQTKGADDRENRGFSIALSRIGLKADLKWNFAVHSEFEVNGGPHGTSVWEGQAAIQVREQLIRFERWGLRVEAGRVTDPSSFDYTSYHVMDQLLTDPYTRSGLLASGFNRGNGAHVSYEVVSGLRVCFGVNGGNPTSTTSSIMVGGTFAPFSRFYIAPWQQVGRDASRFPADEFHFLVLSPSLTYTHRYVDAQTSLQFFRANTNTSSTSDQPIDGMNIRVGARVKLLDNALRLWANFSYVQNEVVDPNDGARLSGEVFRGLTTSAGIDYDFWGKSGVGVQYAMVRDQQGQGTRTTQHFLNIGATWWMTDWVALAARFAMFIKCEEPNSAGCPEKEGSRSFFLTVRSQL